jgi:hypothetical protein
MILFFNVKITQYGLSYYQRANYLPTYDRVDIFKYCLASYASMLPIVSKCIFYIELAPEFVNRQGELAAWIQELFPADKLELHWRRNNYTREWREVCEQFADDDLIWYGGNDDHIFVDYDLDIVKSAITNLQQDPNPYSIMGYSHWPEQLRLAMHYHGELTPDGNFIKYTWRTFDAVCIIKGARLKQYWRDIELGNQVIFRTDALYHIGYQLMGPQYTPTRELVRHYDGYSHVNPNAMPGVAPPLFIPPGFFTKTMKIRIGYPNRLDDWTNFNPNLDLFANNSTGADYRWVEEDIPLFWRDRIVEIDTAPDYDVTANYIARDQALLRMTNVPMNCYTIDFTEEGAPPLAWFNKHLKHVKN